MFPLIAPANDISYTMSSYILPITDINYAISDIHDTIDTTLQSIDPIIKASIIGAVKGASCGIFINYTWNIIRMLMMDKMVNRNNFVDLRLVFAVVCMTTASMSIIFFPIGQSYAFASLSVLLVLSYHKK